MYVCLCVFTGFSIILPLIAMIYAKGMRASQPQCQILNVGICVVVYVHKIWNMKHWTTCVERMQQQRQQQQQHYCDRMEWTWYCGKCNRLEYMKPLSLYNLLFGRLTKMHSYVQHSTYYTSTHIHIAHQAHTILTKEIQVSAMFKQTLMSVDDDHHRCIILSVRF